MELNYNRDYAIILSGDELREILTHLVKDAKENLSFDHIQYSVKLHENLVEQIEKIEEKGTFVKRSKR